VLAIDSRSLLIMTAVVKEGRTVRYGTVRYGTVLQPIVKLIMMAPQYTIPVTMCSMSQLAVQ